MRPRSFLPLAVLLSCFACGDDESVAPPPPPAAVDAGPDFSVDVLEGNRLVVRAADGRVLLDGLPPAAVAADGPPLTGFAARTVTTTYEMQFGAFKPTVTPQGPWIGATTLAASGSRVSILANGAEIASLTFAAEGDGHLVVDVALPAGAPALDPATPETRTKLSWAFACSTDDHFAGFGAQTWDADHRGQTIPTFVTEGGIGKALDDEYNGPWMFQGQRHSSHMPIPQYLSSRGYMLTLQSDRKAAFALCSESESVARIEMDMPTRIHLFDGPEPATSIERASATFGRPRMPPRVAFAPWIDAVFGSENVRRVAQKLRDESVPVSVVWTEDWRGGEWDGETYALKEEWQVDEALYPDFGVLADDLHALGYHVHVYFNPFIYEGSQAWAETADQGWLIENASGEPYTFTGAKLTTSGMIDLDDPDARAWAVGKMRAAMELGADGWMHDFAEWLPTDAFTAGSPAYERHNLYPVRWQEVAREAIDGAPDGAERLFFARSGWFGTPELVDVFWAGDQGTTFAIDDGLPTIVPQAIGLGLVGVSTYGHDIAGYQSVNVPGSTKELFFRWTELGAWSPVMRTHHGAQPDKEWSWEKDDETIDHFRRYAELHMSLVPTFVALADEASRTGMPMWRGLALHYPEDAAVWPITDEILLGRHILIAPVVTEGATSRDVYLPAGRWYPWSGGGAVAGSATIQVDAPVGEIPVFVRAGAIVPTYPAGVMTLVNGSAAVPDASSVGDDRVVYVFLGGDGTFEEVDGLSYSLTSPEEIGGIDSVSFAPAGGGSAALGPCTAEPVAPCVAETEDGVSAFVSGSGVLEIEGASGTTSFEVEGAGAATIVVRR